MADAYDPAKVAKVQALPASVEMLFRATLVAVLRDDPLVIQAGITVRAFDTGTDQAIEPHPSELPCFTLVFSDGASSRENIRAHRTDVSYVFAIHSPSLVADHISKLWQVAIEAVYPQDSRYMAVQTSLRTPRRGEMNWGRVFAEPTVWGTDRRALRSIGSFHVRFLPRT